MGQLGNPKKGVLEMGVRLGWAGEATFLRVAKLAQLVSGISSAGHGCITLRS